MRRLIIRPGAIGDFIVSLPALEALSKEGDTEVWTTTQNLPLVRFTNHARAIIATGLDSFGLPGRPDEPALIAQLRSFHSIVSWYGTNRPEFREAVTKLHLPFVFHDALPDGSCHAVDFYLRQVGGVNGGTPRLHCQAAPEGFIAIHPFSGGRQKNWPLDRFRELASAIAGDVRWTAGPEEDLPEATRFESLWDLAQWLSKARLFIGNDSGISHLAAAAGVPVIALFGPTDPAVWSPRGSRVRTIRAADHRMESITVEQVQRAIPQR